MKQIGSVIVALLVLLSVSGLGAAVTITGLSDVSTTDTTPAITFTVTGNNSSYAANLFIDSVASGTVTATNATEVSITCNQTLASMTTSNFAGIVVVLGDVVDVFSPIVDLIISVGTVMIAIAMIVFVMGLITGLFAFVNGGFGKMGK
jgi:hypothetical protein